VRCSAGIVQMATFFSAANMTNYYLSSVVLKRVDVIKALGVMFDYELGLSFVCHCKEKIILLQNIFYVRFHQQEFYLFNRTGICNIV